jgi:hypothetical protein
MYPSVRVSQLLGLVVASGLLAAACGPAGTALPPTSLPTAVPATATAVPPTVEPTPDIIGVGTDINQTLPPGDGARGKLLVAATINDYSCNYCHVAVDESVATRGPGPVWLGDMNNDGAIAARAETRYLGDDYTGDATTAQQYLFESIVLPNAYIIKHVYYEWEPGKSAHPDNYGQLLTAQDLADIIAYLETIK